MPCPLCNDPSHTEEVGELSKHATQWWCSMCDFFFVVISLFCDDWSFLDSKYVRHIYRKMSTASQDATD